MALSPPHRKVFSFLFLFPFPSVFSAQVNAIAQTERTLSVSAFALLVAGPFQNAINESIIDPFVEDIPSFVV